jgi:uncharacterized membrane protein YfcA
LEAGWYELLLGGILLVPALFFLINFRKTERVERAMPWWLGVGLGALLGLVSGLTGIGGGVLLSPILVLGKFSGQKTTAATSAPFIFVNSAAGLLGTAAHTTSFDQNILYFAIATLVGGSLGATLGAQKFGSPLLRRMLGIVLLIASLKLLLT